MDLGGTLGRMVGLTLDHSMMLFVILPMLCFLGGVFGVPKLLVGFVSLFGRRLGIRSSLVIIWPSGDTIW